MAKRTAIIDIGSNSISLVVYEKSSRYAFHLIEKLRGKVRIGEGAYENGGVIHEKSMQKAYSLLEDYVHVIDSLKCRKVLIVATSALRDAPNKKDFIKRVQKGLKLNIKVIEGTKEAYLGAIGAINLLPDIDDCVTIDIGGGSTELALIKDKKVIKSISLNLGTVRLKEIFFDKKRDFEEVEKYINDILSNLSNEYKSQNIIGIGGTIRALSSAILKDSKYPLDSLHGFSYDLEKYGYFIKQIAKSSVLELKNTSISKSRYDTIREGSAIFYLLSKMLGATRVITSKAGVREGVYLSDLLRNSNHLFPVNFNVSIKNLIDRFAIYKKQISWMQKISLKIYQQTSSFYDKEEVYKDILSKCAKLTLITRRLNIYSNSDSSFEFLLENLNFSLSHSEKLLIALCIKYAYCRDINEKEIKKYKVLLPSIDVIKWLSFTLSLAICINKNKKIQDIDFEFLNEELLVIVDKESFLTLECIKKLKKPMPFAIVFRERV